MDMKEWQKQAEAAREKMNAERKKRDRKAQFWQKHPRLCKLNRLWRNTLDIAKGLVILVASIGVALGVYALAIILYCLPFIIVIGVGAFLVVWILKMFDVLMIMGLL